MKYHCEFCGQMNKDSQLFNHVCDAKCFYSHQRKHESYQIDGDYKNKCLGCDQDFYSEKCFNQHKEKRFKLKNKSVCDI